MKVDRKRLDTKEFELPETLFVRDIENRVFQGIVLQCLSEIEGIGLVEGNFIENIFNRGQENVAGIYAEQDNQNHCVNIKVEVNVQYGVSIPAKAEEIQTKIADEITRITGLHVSSIHVIFKNILPLDQIKMMRSLLTAGTNAPTSYTKTIEEDYSDEF